MGCCLENDVKHCVDHITCSILVGCCLENHVKWYVDHITCNKLGGVLLGKQCKKLHKSYQLYHLDWVLCERTGNSHKRYYFKEQNETKVHH